MTSNLTYANVVNELSQRIPELWESGEELFEDAPHMVLGTFAQVLREWITQQQNSDALRRAVSFMNQMAESADGEVVNMLQISVFAVMCDDDRCCDWLREQEALSPACVRLLERAVAPLPEGR